MHGLVLTTLLLVSAPLTGGFLSRLHRFQRQDDSQNERYYCVMLASHCAESNLGKYMMTKPEDELAHLQQVLANRTLLGDIASDVENTADCLDNVVSLSTCGFFLEWSGPVRFVSDLINSPGFIDKMAALSVSPCLADESLVRELEGKVKVCSVTLLHALQGRSDMCASVSQFLQCVEHEGTQVCGPASGELVNSIKEFALSPTRAPDVLAWVSSQIGMDLTPCEQQLVITSC